MNFFLIFWLTCWSFVCVFFIYSVLSRDTSLTLINLFSLVFVWVGEITCACLLIYLLFCKKCFYLNPSNLTIETNILGFKQYRKIEKYSIERFVQVKDGGKKKDSFPSWGLKIEADKKTTLIFRQPYEKSHWLGQFLAQWAKVEFVEASNSVLDFNSLKKFFNQRSL